MSQSLGQKAGRRTRAKFQPEKRHEVVSPAAQNLVKQVEKTNRKLLLWSAFGGIIRAPIYPETRAAIVGAEDRPGSSVEEIV